MANALRKRGAASVRAGTAAPTRTPPIPLGLQGSGQRLAASTWSFATPCTSGSRPAQTRSLNKPKFVCAASRASTEGSWQWDQDDYHTLHFASPSQCGPMKLFEDSSLNGTFNGVLVFKRENDAMTSDELQVLEVFVSGDICYNTWSLLTHRLGERPMVHELMWTLLERAHSRDAKKWSLLRVAIVNLEANTFIGRLFFGDAETGEVMWDCDCRPSDGCYLSLRAHCPFFVHKRVWDQTCVPLRSSSVYKLVNQQRSASLASSSTASSGPSSSNTSMLETDHPSSNVPFYRSPVPSGGEGSSGGGGGSMNEDASSYGKPADATASADKLSIAEVTLIRPDDPAPLVLLKRQLAVAVAEENYAEAARIRDHPWMAMYRDVHALRLRGRYEDAHRVEEEVKRQIEAMSSIEA